MVYDQNRNETGWSVGNCITLIFTLSWRWWMQQKWVTSFKFVRWCWAMLIWTKQARYFDGAQTVAGWFLVSAGWKHSVVWSCCWRFYESCRVSPRIWLRHRNPECGKQRFFCLTRKPWTQPGKPVKAPEKSLKNIQKRTDDQNVTKSRISLNFST